MIHYPYLIVGGGMAADSAARGIRQVDPTAPIGLLSRESDPPYNRPPLSKGLWKKTPLSRIWRGTEKLDVQLHLGRTVTALDPALHRVTDDLGEEYTYGKLCLAIGGEPIRPPWASRRILYYRTLADYQALRAQAESASRFVVIGGGFIGSEIACALAGMGKQVSMVFLEEGLLARLFPPHLSAYLNRYYQERGVTLLPGRKVSSVEDRDSQVLVRTQEGDELLCDGVVAGLGIRPNLDLPRQSVLEVGDGVLVDAHLRTSQADIFAAGDVINFHNPAVGRRMRVEHEENANQSGLVAGQNMAGAEVEYTLLPSMYSDLFDLGYEAVGLLDPALETVVDWQEEYAKGVVYYLQDGLVKGVLLWNWFGQVDAARGLIASREPLTPDKYLRP